MTPTPSRTWAIRDKIKRDFLATLTDSERDYLIAKRNIPVRLCMNDRTARRIIEQAREAGVYQKKTIPMDIMSGLINFSTRP